MKQRQGSLWAHWVPIQRWENHLNRQRLISCQVKNNCDPSAEKVKKTMTTLNQRIISIVKNTTNIVKSMLSRNGLLINHHLLEVNGQNVVGVKDKVVGVVIEEGGDVITITIIPTYIYNTIMKK